MERAEQTLHAAQEQEKNSQKDEDSKSDKENKPEESSYRRRAWDDKKEVDIVVVE